MVTQYHVYPYKFTPSSTGTTRLVPSTRIIICITRVVIVLLDLDPACLE